VAAAAASAVEDATCAVDRPERSLRRDVGQQVGDDLCGRGRLGVWWKAQQRVKRRAGGMVAVAVGGELQLLGLCGGASR
jgi:hypothetical protein